MKWDTWKPWSDRTSCNNVITVQFRFEDFLSNLPLLAIRHCCTEVVNANQTHFFLAGKRKIVSFFQQKHKNLKRGHIVSSVLIQSLSVVWCKVQGHLSTTHPTMRGLTYGKAHGHSFSSCWTTSCIRLSTISAQTKTMSLRPTTNRMKPNTISATLSNGTARVMCFVSCSRSDAGRIIICCGKPVGGRRAHRNGSARQCQRSMRQAVG